MNFEIVDEEKDSCEIQFDEKEVAVALVGVLLDNGVDAYWYEPHPLKPFFRIHVDAVKPVDEIKKAVKGLDSNWSEFKKAVESKL